MALLEFKKVAYLRENNYMLKNISLKVEAGDFISIIGSSGSGKSTFLKLCCHLISPTEGKITYKDKDMLQYNPTDLRREIGYCAQTPYLFDNTVEDNFSFLYLIRNEKINLARVQSLFSSFNLDFSFFKEDVKSLSGGEKQRIALIRTILFNPQILLLDEVSSALDVDNTLLVEEVIKGLNQKGITILWVTHNLEQSRKYANKLLTVENGEIQALEAVK